MHAYFERRYVASNIILAVAGNFAWPHLLALAEKHCGDWQQRPRRPARSPRDPRFRRFQSAHQGQGHPGARACSSPRVRRPSRLCVTPPTPWPWLIGDDSGSRLYWALIDPGLADSADSSFQDYQGTGSFFTSFSCEPDQTEENLAIVLDVLREVQRKGITEEELHQAKSKIGSRVVRGNERPMGRMQAIGMTWTYLHEYRTVDDELKAFDSVSLQSVREVLNRYPVDRVTTLALGPLASLAGRGATARW